MHRPRAQIAMSSPIPAKTITANFRHMKARKQEKNGALDFGRVF